MTASPRGTTEEPGANVRQKSGLNRVILRTGWAALGQMLDPEAAEVIEINLSYTSQTCTSCGVIDADSHRTQAEASCACVARGHAQNADLNAARNILASGTGAAARRWPPQLTVQRIATWRMPGVPHKKTSQTILPSDAMPHPERPASLCQGSGLPDESPQRAGDRFAWTNQDLRCRYGVPAFGRGRIHREDRRSAPG